MEMSSIRIGPRTVAAIQFVLTTAEGDELDRSDADSPLVFMTGTGALVPGLERALIGKLQGDQFNVTVEPEAGFGRNDPSLAYYVPRNTFPKDMTLEPGMMFGAESMEGQEVTFWVTNVDDEDKIVVNENHPLADITLCYDVQVLGVREATDEEHRDQKLSKDLSF